MVVVAYGLILPQAVLDIPRLGCLNIHASLLPRWRGAAPIQRAILAGDERTGYHDHADGRGPRHRAATAAARTRDRPARDRRRSCTTGSRRSVRRPSSTPCEAGRRARCRRSRSPRRGATYAAKIRKDEARIDWSTFRRARSIARCARSIRGRSPRPGSAASRCASGRRARAPQRQSLPARVRPGRDRARGGRPVARRHRRGPARAAHAAVSRPQAAQGARCPQFHAPLRGERFGEVIA